MLTVGDILKKTREKNSITLSKIEKHIKIREKFLQAIENNNWNFFSSKIYIEGIIKNYANYLQLDAKKILAFFHRDYEKHDEIKFKRRVSSKYLVPETKRIIKIGLIILFSIFFLYFAYQLKIYFTPPKLIYISPKNEIFNKENKIKIIGKTDKEATINIFGERIYQNKEGIFEYELPLRKGKNDISIEIIGASGQRKIFKKSFYKQ